MRHFVPKMGFLAAKGGRWLVREGSLHAKRGRWRGGDGSLHANGGPGLGGDGSLYAKGGPGLGGNGFPQMGYLGLVRAPASGRGIRGAGFSRVPDGCAAPFAFTVHAVDAGFVPAGFRPLDWRGWRSIGNDVHRTPLQAIHWRDTVPVRALASRFPPTGDKAACGNR